MADQQADAYETLKPLVDHKSLLNFEHKHR